MQKKKGLEIKKRTQPENNKRNLKIAQTSKNFSNQYIMPAV
jgi:hypothetical protein